MGSKRPQRSWTARAFDTGRKEAFEEMAWAMDARPEIKNPGYHVMLSVPVGEELSEEQWQQAVDHYMQGMKFEGCPYVALRHNDTEHHHVHIIASRVSEHDGHLVSDSHDFYRSQTLAREIEKKLDLTPGRNSWEPHPDRAKPMSQEDWHRQARRGEGIGRGELAREVLGELKTQDKVTHFASSLGRKGIKMVPRLNAQQDKIIGVYFEKGGVRIKGSKVHRSCSWGGLTARLEYKPERDLKTLAPAPEGHGAGRLVQASVRQDTQQPPRTVEPRLKPDLAQYPARPAVVSKAKVNPPSLKQDAKVSDEAPSSSMRSSSAVPSHAPRVPQSKGLNRNVAAVSQPQVRPESPPQSQLQQPVPTRSSTGAQATNSSSVSPSTSGQLKRATPHDVSMITQAIERAKGASSPEQWLEQLAVQGVQVLPKVGSQDQTQIKGLYLGYEGRFVPASKVDRSSSIGNIVKRFGEGSRHTNGLYKEVFVSGRGRVKPQPNVTGQTKPSVTPNPAPVVPSSTTTRGVVMSESKPAQGSAFARERSRMLERDQRQHTSTNPTLHALSKKSSSPMAFTDDQGKPKSLTQVVTDQRAKGQDWDIATKSAARHYTVMERALLTSQGKFTLLVDRNHKVHAMPHLSAHDNMGGRDVELVRNRQGLVRIKDASRPEQLKSTGPASQDARLESASQRLAKPQAGSAPAPTGLSDGPSTASKPGMRQWIAQHKQRSDQDVTPLRQNKTVVGKPTGQTLDLKEGKWDVVAKSHRELSLVPHDARLGQMQGMSVRIQRRTGSALEITSMDKVKSAGPSKDKGPDR